MIGVVGLGGRPSGPWHELQTVTFAGMASAAFAGRAVTARAAVPKMAQSTSFNTLARIGEGMADNVGVGRANGSGPKRPAR